MNATEFIRRLDAIPQDRATKKRDPAAVTQLVGEAIYSISLAGDSVSRHLADEILKAIKA